MLIKAGVDISRLERTTRRSLTIVAVVLRDMDLELIITSTYDGNHMPGSLHYANQAYDVRVPHKQMRRACDGIKDALSFDFDVILEEDHIHVEYDPK